MTSVKSSIRTISKEGMKIFVELITLAKIIELCCQHGLDVLRINSEDDSLSASTGFDGIGILGVAPGHEVLVPKVKVIIAKGMLYGIPNEGDS